MSSSISVTEGESVVLAALWRHGPLTPSGLLRAVKLEREWGDATIKTLLARLMQKQAVRSQREDGRLLYHPLLTRDCYVAGELQALADRLFSGDLSKVADYTRGWSSTRSGAET